MRSEMCENESEKIMRELFEQHKFRVTRIPRQGDARSYDYRVDDGQQSYLVEVKDKDNSPSYKQLLQEARENGQSTGAIKIDRNNTISGIIRDAADQLKTSHCEGDPFRVIWLSCLGQDSENVASQFEHTLYGCLDVLILGQETIPPVVKKCFYFDYNEFFNIPHVDAAIIYAHPQWALCLNGFAPQQRYNDFKQSKLFSLFGGAIRDPIAFEKNGEALIADTDAPRRDAYAIQKYLCEKYGVSRVSPMSGAAFTSMIIIPRQ